MAAIVRYGAYVPRLRLPRSVVAGAWGEGPQTGHKAVANHDEDSVTLAVEASRDCLRGADRSVVDGVLFATTTSPYLEKQSAALLATVLDLPEGVLTADLCNSLRSGTTALELAGSLVDAGRARNVLVAVADMRLAHPGSSIEPWMGDGSAAFLVGPEPGVARWNSFASVVNEMLDCWRTDQDRFVRTWEDRWHKKHGLLEVTARVVRDALEKAGLTGDGIARAALYAPDKRSLRELARSLGLEKAARTAEDLLERCGSTGAALAPMMLARILEDACPGERILVAGYGDGADVLVLEATEEICRRRPGRGVSGWLAKGREIVNYERFLWYRNLVEVQPPPALLVGSSATVLWRDRSSVLKLHGSRCRACGQPAFPIQRVCNGCGAADAFEEIALSESKGRVFTFTLDYLAAQVDPPLIQTVVDLEPGCRIYTSMTDADPAEVKPDLEVEMTFRRTRKAEGFYNYFWKCRPLN